MTTTAVFTLMHYLGDNQGLRDLHNDFYGYSMGDELYWADYETGPVYPVNEQPESENFFILYNYETSQDEGEYWFVDYDVSIVVVSNNIGLIDSTMRRIRALTGKYSISAEAINQWAAQNMPDSEPIKYMRYLTDNFTLAAEQENGVYVKEALVRIRAIEC